MDKGYRIWDTKEQKYVPRHGCNYSCSYMVDNSKSFWKHLSAIKAVVDKSKELSRFEIHLVNRVYDFVEKVQ